MTLDDVAGRFAYGEDHEAFRQTVRSFLRKEGVPLGKMDYLGQLALI